MVSDASAQLVEATLWPHSDFNLHPDKGPGLGSLGARTPEQGWQSMGRSLARLAHHPTGLACHTACPLTRSHFHSLSTYCVPVFVTDPGGAPAPPGPWTMQRAVSRGPEAKQRRRPRRGTRGEGCMPLALGDLHQEVRGGEPAHLCGRCGPSWETTQAGPAALWQVDYRGSSVDTRDP